MTAKVKPGWIEVSVAVSGKACNAVADLLDRYGKGGAVVEGVVHGRDHQAKLDTQFFVKAYLFSNAHSRDQLQSIERGLQELRKEHNIPKALVREMGIEDWTEGWKKGIPVSHIGRRMVIVPSWKTYAPKGEEVVIRMDPGMAFGSGLHPTTRLCLIALEKYLRPQDHVLDVGTGSGIQTIAAAKLGAAKITALDIDSVAVETARKNVAANAVSSLVEVHTGTVHSLYQTIKPSNLAVVNILAYTIIDLLSDLREKLLPGGVLIAGGILDELVPEVEEAIRHHGFVFSERFTEEEWVSIVARKGTNA